MLFNSKKLCCCIFYNKSAISILKRANRSHSVEIALFKITAAIAVTVDVAVADSGGIDDYEDKGASIVEAPGRSESRINSKCFLAGDDDSA